MFLKGEVDDSQVDDPRGETVPQPFVSSWEELRERREDSDSVTVALAAAAQETEKPHETEKTQEAEKPKKKVATEPVGDIDISKLDIRVGVIRKAWEHPEADKLYCEEIDLGEDSGPRQIASGLRAHYSLGDLQGRKVLVLANLKERKLVGLPSHGMVLCATNAAGKVVFVDPPEGAPVGERVMTEGFDGEPATENQVIKKKMLETIFPDLATNDDGVATYRGKPMTTSAGPCNCELSNASIS
jgi:methionine--tRNA ligase beta chain